MSNIILPDITGVMVNLLRDDPELVALCTQAAPTGAVTPRISANFPETDDAGRQWPMPHFAILVRRVGGPGADLELPFRLARFDMICYGPGSTSSAQMRSADQLWRTLDPVICPPASQGIPNTFHARGCEVVGIYSEADPIPSVEPGTNWRRVIAPYLVEYAVLPVPV